MKNRLFERTVLQGIYVIIRLLLLVLDNEITDSVIGWIR